MSTLAVPAGRYPFRYQDRQANADETWLLLPGHHPVLDELLIRTYALILILKANGLISTLLV